MTGGINNQSAEVMIERAAVSLERHIRESGEFADFIRGPSQKTPVYRIIMVHFPISLQRARVVNFCIERDREEVPVGGTIRQRTELSRGLLKILRQPWTIIGNRTAREEERDCQRL